MILFIIILSSISLLLLLHILVDSQGYLLIHKDRELEQDILVDSQGYYAVEQSVNIQPIKGNSSEKMLSYISKYPNEWKAPIKLCIVADESYIGPIDIFYKTLQSFGFNSYDISIFCITRECEYALKQININSEFIEVKECETAPMKRIKCLISLGKAKVIHTTLSRGFSIFFFDLDIYFKASPLDNFIPEANVHIYAQNNDDNTANYGCIFIRSSPLTISVFQDLEVDALTDVWDQQLMNNQLQKHQVPFAYFDRNLYYLFLHPIEKFPDQMNLVHMICVEGPLNKMLIARHRASGPFNTPFLYTHNKTIAIYADYNSPERKTSYTHQELVGMIRRLMEIAVATKRFIRLVGWKYYLPVKSLFDVDLLNAHNVTLVEGKYWENYAVFNSGYNFTTMNYAINDQNDFENFLISQSERNFDSFCEISLTFSHMFLENSYHSNFEKFLCKFYDDFTIGCTRTCSGNHFRFRNI